MPAPSKIALLPEELRDWLRDELAIRGFGGHREVTDALNARLEAEGLSLSIGKSAVGDFSKALKEQREAFAFAEVVLADLDIEGESDMHKALMQMIATSAVRFMRSVHEGEGHLDPKDLMNMGRMMKDLMSSAGIREKLLADERARIAREAREALEAEQLTRLDQAVSSGSIDAAAAQRAREVMGFA